MYCNTFFDTTNCGVTVATKYRRNYWYMAINSVQMFYGSHFEQAMALAWHSRLQTNNSWRYLSGGDLDWVKTMLDLTADWSTWLSTTYHDHLIITATCSMTNSCQRSHEHVGSFEPTIALTISWHEDLGIIGKMVEQPPDVSLDNI